MRLIFLVAGCVLIITGCVQQGAEGQRRELAQDMRPEDAFIGTWTLVEWTREAENGDVVYPYGEDAFGRIFYTENGRMAAILMRHNRNPVGDVRPGQLSAEDRAILGDGFFAYSGTFDVDIESKKVTHHVEACTNPNWVGQDRVRTFETAGEDRIVLRTTESVPFSVLTWQREQ